VLLFLLILWILSAVLVLLEQRPYRIVIYFGIFSLITSVAYLFLGSPDVAMAEAGISAFTTIFFLVCMERYYAARRKVGAQADSETRANTVPVRKRFVRILPALLFSAGLLGLFIWFIPTGEISTHLRDQYLALFISDVGGENAATAIYLGYRLYDTLFEALILVIAVVAVSHMSWFDGTAMTGSGRRRAEIGHSSMAVFTMRIICPIILLFGAYLFFTVHLTAGGGFQGGLAVASFFICRYLIYDIYDIPIKKVIKMEELVFIGITIVAVLAIFLGVVEFAQIPPVIYLNTMNVLIGMKVACSFFILFYRYIAIERAS